MDIHQYIYIHYTHIVSQKILMYTHRKRRPHKQKVTCWINFGSTSWVDLWQTSTWDSGPQQGGKLLKNLYFLWIRFFFGVLVGTNWLSQVIQHQKLSPRGGICKKVLQTKYPDAFPYRTLPPYLLDIRGLHTNKMQCPSTESATDPQKNRWVDFVEKSKMMTGRQRVYLPYLP